MVYSQEKFGDSSIFVGPLEANVLCPLNASQDDISRKMFPLLCLILFCPNTCILYFLYASLLACHF